MNICRLSSGEDLGKRRLQKVRSWRPEGQKWSKDVGRSVRSSPHFLFKEETHTFKRCAPCFSSVMQVCVFHSFVTRSYCCWLQSWCLMDSSWGWGGVGTPVSTCVLTSCQSFFFSPKRTSTRMATSWISTVNSLETHKQAAKANNELLPEREQ